MKYLILGGSGFIGQAIVDRLIINNEVIVADKKSSEINCEYVYCDLTKINYEHLPDDVDIIINCASVLGISRVEKKPFETLINNFYCAKSGLEIALYQKSLKKYVYFSSSEVYGKFANNKSEYDSLTIENTCESRWSYATSKIYAEELTFSFCKTHKIPFLIIRPFNIYGVGRKKEGAINSLIYQAVNYQSVRVTGTGDQTRAWCNIEDFVDGLLLCLEKGSDNTIYNIGNPNELYSINDIVLIITDIIGKSINIYFKDNDNQMDIIARSPNINKLKALGYRPKITVYDGIQEIIKKGYKHEAKS